MELLNIDNISLFIVFFLPGFISVKTYQLLAAVDKVDVSNSVMEVVGFSCLNLTIFSWLIYLNIKFDWIYVKNIGYFMSLFTILIIGPIVLSWIYHRLTQSKLFSNYGINPVKQPWDSFFSRKESCWVVVHLKDGNKVGGKYSTLSIASAYPRREQIYIEEIYMIDEKNAFIGRKKDTYGAIINSEEIKYVEFYKTKKDG